MSNILNHFNVNIENYSYSLPDERIAKYPLDKREESKLLIWSENQEIRQTKFKDISLFIPENSLLICNNTKVIHARLIFQKKTGAQIEIFCLAPHNPVDYQLALSSTRSCTWKCLVGNSKKWKDGTLEQIIPLENKQVILTAKRKHPASSEGQIIEFEWNTDHTFASLLEYIGKIPIPPYLNRESEDIDKYRYQTVYSTLSGSVAAPTAGLHFSEEILNLLKKRKIKLAEVTLHVGAGTFQPVKEQNVRNHQMHSEQIAVHRQTLIDIIHREGKVIATGTTTLRTLESLYWLGVKAINKMDINNLHQWEWEKLYKKYSIEDSFTALLAAMENQNTTVFTARTEIMIVPGYQFKVTDVLITNFHQPKSTLLLLIAAFTGNRWKEIYTYALQHDYRFLSYGDSSLLIR